MWRICFDDINRGFLIHYRKMESTCPTRSLEFASLSRIGHGLFHCKAGSCDALPIPSPALISMTQHIVALPRTTPTNFSIDFYGKTRTAVYLDCISFSKDVWSLEHFLLCHFFHFFFHSFKVYWLYPMKQATASFKPPKKDG